MKTTDIGRPGVFLLGLLLGLLAALAAVAEQRAHFQYKQALRAAGQGRAGVKIPLAVRQQCT